MRQSLKKDGCPILIFTLMAKEGEIDEKMMYNTYNMGIGMVMAVDAADVEKTMEAVKAAGETPYVIGRIEAGAPRNGQDAVDLMSVRSSCIDRQSAGFQLMEKGW